MRVTSMAIALAATLALPTLAMAQSGLPPKPYPSNTENAGTPPGAYTAQGAVTNPGPRYTTGEGYYGGRAGPAPMRTYHRYRHGYRMIER